VHIAVLIIESQLLPSLLNVSLTCSLKLDAVIREAKQSMTYDAGVADLKAQSVTMPQPAEVIATDLISSTSSHLAQLVLDRGVSFAQAREIHANALPDPKGGFYKSHHLDITTKNPLYLMAMRRNLNPGPSRYIITRPNTGTSPFEMDGSVHAVASLNLVHV